MPPVRPPPRARAAAVDAAVLASARPRWDGFWRRLTRRRRTLDAVARVVAEQAETAASAGSLAELSMALAQPGPARDRTIERLAGMAAADARALGDLISAQRPPALAERGLAGALGDLATWYSDVHGLECAARLGLSGELAPELETAVYRAAESLLAAAADGGAERARLLVAGDPDQVVVELAAGSERLALTLATNPAIAAALDLAGEPADKGGG